MFNEKTQYKKNLKEKNINKFVNKTMLKKIIYYYHSKKAFILKFKYNKIIIIYLIFILTILFRIILSNEYIFKKRKLVGEDFCISLRINAAGPQSIINELYQDKIKVVIEGEEINFTDNKIIVAENVNIINIKCLDNFTNCDNMFENLTNIIEVNLLNFYS